MKESAIESRVVRHCKVRGYYCRKLTSPANKGMVDRLICHGGKALFLELKRPGKKPTPLQFRELGLLGAAGMRADWADSAEEAVRIIDDFFAEEVL